MSKKLSWLLILAFVPFAIACSDDDEPNPQPDMGTDMVITDMAETDTTVEPDTIETDTVTSTNFEKLQIAAQAYLDWAAPSSFVLKAPDLNANLIDGDDTNNPYILSVRAADHYAIGHIPGAANIPYKTIHTADISALPTDNQVLVYCYTGHTGQLATVVLGCAGYDTRNLKFGFNAWTENAEARVAAEYADPDTDQATETTDNPGAGPFDPPDMSALTSTTEKELVLEAYGAYLTRLDTTSPVISAGDLATNLADGDDTNDPQIISVRKAEHYAIGHIPGAINIPWADIAKAENLAKIDPSKPVVVYCYTGHTGGVAAAVLGLLGYDVRNLKHGIMGWTTDSAVRGGVSSFADDTTAKGDFTFEGTAAN